VTKQKNRKDQQGGKPKGKGKAVYRKDKEEDDDIDDYKNYGSEDDDDDDDRTREFNISQITPVSELKFPFGRLDPNQSYQDTPMHQTDEKGRPQRTRIKPVAYWNGERVEYKVEKRKSTSLPLLTIKNVIRQTPSRLESKRKKLNKKNPTKKEKTKGGEDEEGEEKAAKLKALGFQEMEIPKIVTLNPGTDEQKSLELMKPKEAAQYLEINPEKYQMANMLGTNEFTTGFFLLKENQSKASKKAQSILIFYVIRGKVEVSCYQTSFVLEEGGQFFIPSGNHYALKNLGTSECELFYARLTTNDEKAKKKAK